MKPIEEQAEKQLRVLKIITWMFLVVGPAVYLVLAQILDTKGIEAKAGNDILLYILLVVGLFNVAVMAPLIVNLAVKQYRTGATPGKSPAQLYVTLSIIQMAMVEAVYIYGLVVFILTGKFAYMLYFFPIGIAASFIYWPRREKYDRLVEKLNQP